ncbi:hypothetical protein ABIA22_002252 [Sinorhizobium fredii]|uniref:phage tail terminator-like protein n=1 Tax=Rhizobium fredii TaxID=380 RepID=UPI003512738D
MAATVDGKITAGLLEHFKTFTLPSGMTHGANVAEPGINYTPVAGVAYVSLEVHHNTPTPVGISMEDDPIRRGFLRANVCWPNGKGIVKATDLASQIADHFGRGSKISFDGTTIWIIEEPELAGDIQGTSHFSIPVTVRWQVFP